MYSVSKRSASAASMATLPDISKTRSACASAAGSASPIACSASRMIAVDGTSQSLPGKKTEGGGAGAAPLVAIEGGDCW